MECFTLFGVVHGCSDGLPDEPERFVNGTHRENAALQVTAKDGTTIEICVIAVLISVCRPKLCSYSQSHDPCLHFAELRSRKTWQAGPSHRLQQISRGVAPGVDPPYSVYCDFRATSGQPASYFDFSRHIPTKTLIQGIKASSTIAVDKDVHLLGNTSIPRRHLRRETGSLSIVASPDCGLIPTLTWFCQLQHAVHLSGPLPAADAEHLSLVGFQ